MAEGAYPQGDPVPEWEARLRTLYEHLLVLHAEHHCDHPGCGTTDQCDQLSVAISAQVDAVTTGVEAEHWLALWPGFLDWGHEGAFVYLTARETLAQAMRWDAQLRLYGELGDDRMLPADPATTEHVSYR